MSGHVSIYDLVEELHQEWDDASGDVLADWCEERGLFGISRPLRTGPTSLARRALTDLTHAMGGTIRKQVAYLRWSRLPVYEPQQVHEHGFPPCAGFMKGVEKIRRNHSAIFMTVTGDTQGVIGTKKAIVDVRKKHNVLLPMTSRLLNDDRLMRMIRHATMMFVGIFQIESTTGTDWGWRLSVHPKGTTRGPRDYVGDLKMGVANGG